MHFPARPDLDDLPGGCHPLPGESRPASPEPGGPGGSARVLSANQGRPSPPEANHGR